MNYLIILGFLINCFWIKSYLCDHNLTKNNFDCKDEKSNRLPIEIQPLNYKINLFPDFNKFKFDGFVVIELLVNKPTKRITLHSETLTFGRRNCSISHNFRNTFIYLFNFSVDFEQNKNFVHFTRLNNETFMTGKYYLRIKYWGILQNDSIHGMFLKNYVNDKNETM